jgi:uncharacterized membrane protein (DUF106 family)
MNTQRTEIKHFFPPLLSQTLLLLLLYMPLYNIHNSSVITRHEYIFIHTHIDSLFVMHASGFPRSESMPRFIVYYVYYRASYAHLAI